MFKLFKKKDLIIYTNSTNTGSVDITNKNTMADIDKMLVCKYGCNLYTYILLWRSDPTLKIGITDSSNKKPNFYLCSVSIKNVNTKNEYYNLKF